MNTGIRRGLVSKLDRDAVLPTQLLSGNEKFLKNLMSVQTMKTDSKRNSNKVDKRSEIELLQINESCFSIGIMDNLKSKRIVNEESVREDKKMKAKQKKKSSLNSRPLSDEEMKIK